MVGRIAVVLFALAATAQADVPGITFRATITGVSEQKAGAGTGSIEVDHKGGPLITITDKTNVLIVTAKERPPAAFGDLKKGAAVEVVHSIILPSCPPQSEAYRVTILAKAK